MTEEDIEYVCNLGLNLVAYLNGDRRKSMPVSPQEWDLVVRWEKANDAEEDLTFWMHVEDKYEV